ncbi:MAG: cyclase family protein [Trueperaceae bacterium]
MWEHTGTHLDAPAHFIEGGVTADKMPLESFIAPIAVISLSLISKQKPLMMAARC